MKYRSTLIFLITSSLFLPGCSQNKQSPQPQPQSYQEEQQDKVPDQLKGIETNIEKIIKSLEGPAVETEGDKNKTAEENKGSGQGDQSKKTGEDSNQNKEGSQNNQGGQDQQSGGQSGQGQGQGQTSPQPQQQQQQKQQDPWQKISPIFNNLHYQWNDYMPKAMKSGASKNLIDNFSNSLNSLTNTILTKNKTNTLLAANSLYAFIPDFYSLYKTKTSPEIKKIRYYIRDAMINSMTANWTQADSDITNLKSSWSMYKTTVSKEQQDTANKLDLSIYELEKVIGEKNQPLIDIKGRVALSNVEATEKSSENASNQGESGGGGQ